MDAVCNGGGRYCLIYADSWDEVANYTQYLNSLDSYQLEITRQLCLYDIDHEQYFKYMMIFESECD